MSTKCVRGKNKTQKIRMDKLPTLRAPRKGGLLCAVAASYGGTCKIRLTIAQGPRTWPGHRQEQRCPGWIRLNAFVQTVHLSSVHLYLVIEHVYSAWPFQLCFVEVFRWVDAGIAQRPKKLTFDPILWHRSRESQKMLTKSKCEFPHITF